MYFCQLSLLIIIHGADIIPNLVVVESEEVQVGHLIDPRRYSDELVMIKAQFHHWVEGAKKRFRLNSLTIQFVVGEVQIFQTRVHMGKNKTCAVVGRKQWPRVFSLVPLGSECKSLARRSERCWDWLRVPSRLSTYQVSFLCCFQPGLDAQDIEVGRMEPDKTDCLKGRVIPDFYRETVRQGRHL